MASVFRGDDNFDTAGGNAVKAWVNFNGTGTVAISASYNVTSITDNGTGDYTINFTTALSDANYGIASAIRPETPTDFTTNPRVFYIDSQLSTSCRVRTGGAPSGAALDLPAICASIFR